MSGNLASIKKCHEIDQKSGKCRGKLFIANFIFYAVKHSFVKRVVSTSKYGILMVPQHTRPPTYTLLFYRVVCIFIMSLITWLTAT